MQTTEVYKGKKEVCTDIDCSVFQPLMFKDDPIPSVSTSSRGCNFSDTKISKKPFFLYKYYS